MLQRRQIILDWTRVEDFEVATAEFRSFEYHVVASENPERLTLTINCLDPKAGEARRLDPNEVAPGTDQVGYADIAGRRMKQLYLDGAI